jgi:hypothetical protein
MRTGVKNPHEGDDACLHYLSDDKIKKYASSRHIYCLSSYKI